MFQCLTWLISLVVLLTVKNNVLSTVVILPRYPGILTLLKVILV